jgi:hypothetical protein
MAFNAVIAGVGDNKRDVYGATDTSVSTITFGAGDTYVAGGLALLAAQFGLSRPIAGIKVIGVNTVASVWDWAWNTQTQKLQMLGAGGGAAGTAAFADATAATAMANFQVTVLVITQR